MIGLRRLVSQRMFFVLGLGLVTAAAATAGTVHRFAVTQSSGAGSLGSTEFLNTQSSGGAVQAQVGPSALTSLSYPFGVFGLYNSSQIGFGALGLSTTSYGVAGQSTSNYASVFALSGGTGPALEGLANASNGGDALYAEAKGSGDGAEIYADGSGTGVYADAEGSGVGLYAVGATGVEGYSFSSGNYPGLYGNSSNGSGVMGIVGDKYFGVEGVNESSGAGTFGTSVSGFGAEGVNETSASPAPSAAPYTYAGVYGLSGNGPGMYGVDTHNVDPVGYAYNNGGDAALFAGVFGYGNDGAGLYGYSSNDFGAIIENDGKYPTLEINDDNTSSSADLMVAQSGLVDGGTIVFQIGHDGSITTSGNITYAGTEMHATDTRSSGNAVETYSAQQSEATVEDVGSAQLVSGSAAVPIAADFRDTIDVSRPYMVFLTPNGESRGLYVASKSPGGFIVRENAGGRSSLAFDYRIIAHPYGKKLARLPRAKSKLAQDLESGKIAGVRSAPAAFNGAAPDPEAKTAARTARLVAERNATLAARAKHRHFGEGPPPPPNMFRLSLLH